MTAQYYTAGQTSHPGAADHGWAIIYDATPGGKDNGDGTRSFSMIFPVLLVSDYTAEPEEFAKIVAETLNAARASEDETRKVSP